MLLSPLAIKLCKARGLDPLSMRGSGPRGRIMAIDLEQVAILSDADGISTQQGPTAVAKALLSPTRPEKEGYFVYDGEADMRALANISLPIAVQCGKLLEKRYSLMDYIVRATVKACCADMGESHASMDVLLFEEEGRGLVALPDAERKTIYKIALELQRNIPIPAGFIPSIVVCDACTSREQVAQQLASANRPRFALVLRGRSPKVGIRVGCDLSSMLLDYTFYASNTLTREQADRIAARLHMLFCDPISLLLLA